MAETTGRITADIPNLIALLAQSLYSDPKVAIRELIQNAHDSCITRQLQHPEDPFEPRIDISINELDKRLVVRDNGSGMTRQELVDFVSVIGASGKQLAEALVEGNRELAGQIIGQFGLGLLSTFVLADVVEIITKAVEPGSQAWSWKCSGSPEYRINPTDKEKPGTDVILNVKPKQAEHIRDKAIQQAVKRFADFLRTPIYINDSLDSVNVRIAPWDRPNVTRRDYWEYARQHFLDEDGENAMPLLTVFPITHEGEDLAFRGILVVPKNTHYAVVEYGDVNVYIKGMLVNEGESDLLPPWAKFVRGVIDFRRGVEPTLSREGAQKTARYFQVADIVGEQLLDYLDNLAIEDRALLREIVTNHNTVIKAWSVRSDRDNDRFFNRVANLVMFDSSEGWISLPEYFDRVERAARRNPEIQTNKIYYFSEKTGGVVEKAIFKAADRPVLDARYGAEEGFLRKYVDVNKKYKLAPLDPTDATIFQEEPDDPGWKLLRNLYDTALDRPVDARVGRFEPAAIPAILLPKSFQAGQTIVDSLLSNQGLPASVREQLQPLQKVISDSAKKAVLYLNANNDLVQKMKKLVEVERPDETVRQALLVVYNNALMLSQHDVLQPDTVKLIYTQNGRAVEMLIDRHLDLIDAEARLARETQRQRQELEEQHQRDRTQLKQDFEERLGGLKVDNERKLEEIEKLRQKWHLTVEDANQIRGAFQETQGELERAKDRIQELMHQEIEMFPHRACFLARPYEGAFKLVEDEVRKHFSQSGVGIEVISPAHKPVSLEVFQGIQKTILQSHFGVADITGANPNVLIELGIMIGAGKPVIILREKDDPTDVPFDLRPYLRIPYKWVDLGEAKFLVGIDKQIDSILSLPEISTAIHNVPRWQPPEAS